MTHVVINDASCLIDLKKGQLLQPMMRLPFHFVVPYPIRETELLTLTQDDWDILDTAGVETYDLGSDAVSKAFALKSEIPKLSANDCFCLVTALERDNAILLTGDGLLRSTAAERQVEVHGVLWIVDRLAELDISLNQLLVSALELWQQDRSVLLPDQEITSRLRRLK